MRDQLSDQWRVIENRNIEFTMRQVPLTGVGLGQEYLFQQEPPRPSATFVYWRYMTHNALLWVWLKAGPVGAFALAYLVARVLLVGSALFGRLRGELRLVAVLPVALVIAQIIFSSVELGLTYGRTMIVMGVAIGLAAQLEESA
jgi:O-antigen ligase